MNYLYLALAIVCEVVATSALKSAEGFTKFWPSVLVIVGYSAAFLCLSWALRTIPVGVAYAIWAGMGIALVSLVAWCIHGQKMDAVSLIGIGLIFTGVIVLNLFSKAIAAH
jgi:small multidrug resistance pump